MPSEWRVAWDTESRSYWTGSEWTEDRAEARVYADLEEALRAIKKIRAEDGRRYAVVTNC